MSSGPVMSDTIEQHMAKQHEPNEALAALATHYGRLDLEVMLERAHVDKDAASIDYLFRETGGTTEFEGMVVPGQVDGAIVIVKGAEAAAAVRRALISLGLLTAGKGIDTAKPMIYDVDTGKCEGGVRSAPARTEAREVEVWRASSAPVQPLPRDHAGRFVCSRTRPLHPSDDTGSTRVVHKGARERDIDSDYAIYYRCEDCGTSWSSEMPG